VFAVIYIRDFALQAVLRHEPELQGAPVALLNDDSAKATVSQVTPAGWEFGVSAGMTSTQAKARCNKITFRLRSAPQEEAAQEILLECAYFCAAYIESTAPGFCTVDLRGLPLLSAHPLERALRFWGQQLRARLESFNLSSQIGIAATPALASQAAQGNAPFCYVTDPKKFWAELSIRSLPASKELLEVLSKWGIHTVGQFLELGKSRIAERLGSAGAELFEQAKSDTIRPLRLTSPRQEYVEVFEFEQLVETLEPLLFIVRRLIEQLVRRLEFVSRAISQIDVTLRLESGQVHQSVVKIASPTRDTNALFRIAHNYLETVRTPSPVAAVALRVKPCAVETQQFQLFETSVRDPNRFYETISRLSALLGADRVGTPIVRDTFRPDDFEMVRPAANGLSQKAERSLVSGAPAARGTRGLALRRFRPPLSATVRLRQGAPVFVESVGPNGSIAKSQGPWRSSGNWWEKLWAREEWDISLNDGGLYRIFLENNRWFVEGAYD
jgi:protein ImuB